MDLRAHLRTELERRRGANGRYSLRAFARSLRMHHATLSRLLGSSHRLSRPRIVALAARLSLEPSEVTSAMRHEDDARVLALLGRADLVPDARWIARRTGLSLDEVALALHRLLAGRRLGMISTTHWRRESPP